MKELVAVLLFLSTLGSAARILAIIPFPSKSHYIIIEPLLQELAARGHQLTVYSSFPQKTPLPNFTDVDCSLNKPIHINNFDFDTLREELGTEILSMHHTMKVVVKDCVRALKESPLQHFDYKREKYDLVITEMFAGDCYVHFAHKLKAPLISIVTSLPLPWTPDKFGLPDNPSYIPNYLMHLSPDMTFIDRMRNFLYLTYAKMIFQYSTNVRIHRMVEDYFQETLPWVEDVASTSSLLLVNSHPSIGQSRPLPPNVINIGGIHLKEPKPLPKDLKVILDKSSKGVILFSFGSMIRISSMQKDKMDMILRVFSRLDQTVIMKYEGEPDHLPTNVIVRNWLPQRDLLEHKAVVALVSHGGAASVMEAVYCAKPMVGVPFFADQFVNVHSLVWKGAAVAVDMDTMSEHGFEYALNEVINNPKYRENMKAVSEQFRDRPLTALQSAVYWTEYVLRHRGATHLRPASTGIPFYQLWLLDVIALLLAALTVIIYSLYYCTKRVMSIFIRKTRFIYDKLKKND